MEHSDWFPEQAILFCTARSEKSNFTRVQLMAFDERNQLFVDVVESVDWECRRSIDENISVKPIQAFGERNSVLKYLQEQIVPTVNRKALQATTWCMVLDLLCTKIYILENRHWDTR